MLDKFLRHVAGMYQAETGAKVGGRAGGGGRAGAGGASIAGRPGGMLPALLRSHIPCLPSCTRNTPSPLPAAAGAFGGGGACGRGGGHPRGLAKGGARGGRPLADRGAGRRGHAAQAGGPGGALQRRGGVAFQPQPEGASLPRCADARGQPAVDQGAWPAAAPIDNQPPCYLRPPPLPRNAGGHRQDDDQVRDVEGGGGAPRPASLVRAPPAPPAGAHCVGPAGRGRVQEGAGPAAESAWEGLPLVSASSPAPAPLVPPNKPPTTGPPPPRLHTGQDAVHRRRRQ